MNNSCSFDVQVTPSDVLDFARLSGDFNPLHVDEAYAQKTEFGKPIAHGAFLLGLVSRVLGMHLPGNQCLLLSLKAQFPKPLFYPSTIRVSAQLKSFHEERKTGTVQVHMLDTARLWTILEAEATFVLHAPSFTPAVKSCEERVFSSSPDGVEKALGYRRLLVTGATGGLGRCLVKELAAHYELLCVSRRSFPDMDNGRVTYAQLDLEEESALDRFLDEHRPSDFYGVLHLSVPPVPRAFVSDDPVSVKRHLYHSVEVPLRVVRWARQSGSQVKRVILFGSTAGSKFPQRALGAYSLGKAVLEHMVKLLTADLAACGATVNVIAPSFLSVGINEGTSERAKSILAAKIPTGRLLEPHDVASVVLFLLSDGSSQVNGTVIEVDGGLTE